MISGQVGVPESDGRPFLVPCSFNPPIRKEGAMSKNGFSTESSEFPPVADPYHVEKLKSQHQVLEKRLQELSRRAILTPHEEIEVRDIKHQKLQIKDWLTRAGGKEIGES